MGNVLAKLHCLVSVVSLPCLCCQSLSMFSSVHSQGEKGESGVPGEKGGRGDPVRIFLLATFTTQLRYRVINQGFLPQGQPGAEGTSGMKGQKVSHINVKCQRWWVLISLCSLKLSLHACWEGLRKSTHLVVVQSRNPLSLFSASNLNILQKSFKSILQQIMKLQVIIYVAWLFVYAPLSMIQLIFFHWEVVC